MTNDSMRELIKSLAGNTIFGVTFIKRGTGEVRDMTCRLDVKKGQTGQGLSFDVVEKGLLPIYDMAKNDYRMINLDTVTELRVKGQVYRFEK